MPKYLSELWPGNNRFCCNKYITGPPTEWASNLVFYILQLGALIPYYVFIAPKMWNEVSPVLPLTLSLSCLLNFLFFFLTSFTDPGIIPRRAFLMLEPQKFAIYLQPNMVDDTGTDRRKFCTTCQIYRTDRASHCSTCGNCVEVFDHHCPFVNNCVGKRNYRFFIGFLSTILLSIILLLANILIFAQVMTGETENNRIAIIVSSIILGVMILGLGGFAVYHFILICCGKTTRQYKKNISTKKSTSRYDWCGRQPSLLNFDMQIDNELETSLTKMLNDQPA